MNKKGHVKWNALDEDCCKKHSKRKSPKTTRKEQAFMLALMIGMTLLLVLGLKYLPKLMPGAPDGFPVIDSVAAQELISKEDVIVLDIRTPEEYNGGHIQNSLNINFYDSSFEEQLNQLDKTKTYLMHCQSGGRSSKAIKMFEELGFESVYHMKGGMKEWRSTDYPTIKS